MDELRTQLGEHKGLLSSLEKRLEQFMEEVRDDIRETRVKVEGMEVMMARMQTSLDEHVKHDAEKYHLLEELASSHEQLKREHDEGLARNAGRVEVARWGGAAIAKLAAAVAACAGGVLYLFERFVK